MEMLYQRLTHLRLKNTLRAQNVAYVKGLMTVLALLDWFISLCGLHWDSPRFRARIACWGRPSFFKTALDLLTTADELALATWRCTCCAIAAIVPVYFFLGNCKLD
jgi:hypothetical protein